jgi:hypothetical protein
VAYIHAAGGLWTSTPGAVDWALKCHNLFDVMMMLRNSEFSVTLATFLAPRLSRKANSLL